MIDKGSHHEIPVNPILKEQFNRIFPKIILFASQAGDAEITQFCFTHKLYIPQINFQVGTRELYIQGNTVKKITLTSHAMPPCDVAKEPVTDGVIQIVQIYNFVNDTTSMHFVRYEDKDGNFLDSL